jgi:hypothetical protein
MAPTWWSNLTPRAPNGNDASIQMVYRPVKAAQRLDKRDLHVHQQVVPIPLEDRVRLLLHDDNDVPRRNAALCTRHNRESENEIETRKGPGQHKPSKCGYAIRDTSRYLLITFPLEDNFLPVPHSAFDVDEKHFLFCAARSQYMLQVTYPLYHK